METAVNFTPNNISECITESISNACKKYSKHSTDPDDWILPPEYFFNVHIYDSILKKFSGSKTLGGISGELLITLESSTKFVKEYAGKPGTVAEVVRGRKRHDVTLWLGDRPTCVIEVKIIGYKYGVLSGFKDDFERLKSVVKGNEKNTVKCGILAIYDCYEGSSKSDDSLFDKHTSMIEQEFSKCKSTVQVDFKWKKIHVKEHDECYMAGAVCVTSK